jgi:hypothetical protein
MLIMNCKILPYVTLIQSIISGKIVYLVGRGYGRITLRWIISQAGCEDGGVDGPASASCSVWSFGIIRAAASDYDTSELSQIGLEI